MRSPRRVRLALGLACARHVLDGLNARHHKTALTALSQGWRWILRPHLQLFEFEEKVEPRLLAPSLAPVLAAVHLLYDCARFPAAVFQDSPPTTLLSSVLSLAREAATDSEAELRWQEEMLQRALGLSNEPFEALGPLVRPSAFGFPEDDLDEKAEARKSRLEDVRLLRAGDLVVGVVRSLLPERAVIAIDDTDDLAYLPLNEVSDPPPASFDGVLQVRQSINARVFKPPVGGGFALLSLKRAPPV